MNIYTYIYTFTQNDNMKKLIRIAPKPVISMHIGVYSMHL